MKIDLNDPKYTNSVFYGCTAYVYRESKSGRRMVTINRDSVKSFQMTYARFVYIMFTGKEIPIGFEVDHIDGNRLNDSFENLQVIPEKMNILKSVYDNVEVQILGVFICPVCNNTFFKRRPRSIYHSFKNKKYEYFYCSRNCMKMAFRKHIKETFKNPKDYYIGMTIDLLQMKRIEQILIKNKVKFVKCSYKKYRELLDISPANVDRLNLSKVLDDTYDYFDAVEAITEQMKKERSERKQQRLIDKALREREYRKRGKIDRFGKINASVLSIDENNDMCYKILNSGIDLLKFGWVEKVSKKTGLTRRQIYRCVNRNEETFKGKIFRR